MSVLWFEVAETRRIPLLTSAFLPSIICIPFPSSATVLVRNPPTKRSGASYTHLVVSQRECRGTGRVPATVCITSRTPMCHFCCTAVSALALASARAVL
jgi:hypothetical protein